VLLAGCAPVREAFDMGITSPVAVGSTVVATPVSTVTAKVGLTQTIQTR
jgi:hypothetical protein